MGKRLIRVFSVSLSEKLPSLLGAESSLILKNGVVLHGRITGYDQTSLQLEDKVRRHHRIQLREVEEIVLDAVSPY